MKARRIGRVETRSVVSLLLVAGSLFALGLSAAAQVNPNPRNPTRNPGAYGQNRRAFDNRRAAPRSFLNELRALIDTLEKRYAVKIVVDPALVVTSKPSAPSETLDVDGALTSVTGQLRHNAAWRRVYLSQAQASNPPSPEKLADAVRGLDRIEQTGLVMENPSNKRVTTFVRFNIPANFAEELEAQQFSTEPIYVLYNTTALTSVGAGKSLQERFADLQAQQMEMMMQMSPEEAAQAMEQGMQMWMKMDPQTRAQFMGTMMRAGMQMWSSMPPQMRQELMGDMIRFGQMMMMNPFDGPGGRPQGPPPPPGRSRP